ncbi:flagellar hook-length control protein FliK, partial [Streptococcus thermophilus]|nr:flagellar hook-length control protein FliK [Streptococcus thermophilus]
HNDSQAGIVNVYPKLDMSSSAGLGTSATTNADDNFNGSTPNQIANPNATGDSDQTLTNSDNNAGNENLANGTW